MSVINEKNVMFYLNVLCIQCIQTLESLNYVYTDMMLCQRVWYILEIGSRFNACYQEVSTMLQGPWERNLTHSASSVADFDLCPSKAREKSFPARTNIPVSH